MVGRNLRMVEILGSIPSRSIIFFRNDKNWKFFLKIKNLKKYRKVFKEKTILLHIKILKEVSDGKKEKEKKEKINVFFFFLFLF